jgi:ubiquinone/menaquinone biosynthesis C-methylase UbiE
MTKLFSPNSIGVHRCCPACLSSEARFLFHKHEASFIECRVCRTVYINPLPPETMLLDRYQDLGASYFTNETKLALDFDLSRYWRELAILPEQARQGSLLDVGCATGSFLLCALEQGFSEVNGIDISVSSVNYANQKIGKSVAIAGDFLKQPFHPEEFNVVTLWATLEHVTKPEEFLREAHRVLKKHGLLCLSVPNRNGLSMRLLGDRYHQVGLDHLNYFTPSGLKLLLKRVGFTSLKTRTRSFNPIIFWKDYRGRHLYGQFEQSDVLADQQQNAELRRNPLVRWTQQAIDLALIPLGIGDLLIVLAKKV